MAVVQANNLLEDQSQLESGCLSTQDCGPYGTFVGVYDGHGFTSEQQSMSVEVIRKAFQATEEGFTSVVSNQWPLKPQIAAVGSCCLVGVICGGTLYTANLGDSRAVLGRIVKATGEVLAVQLSDEHNASVASISRSIGDVYLKKAEFNKEPLYAKFRLREPFKKPILSADPSISVRQLESDDQFIIFASDGLWEHLSNQEAVNIVQNNPRNGIARKLVKVALQEAAKKREMRYSDLKKIERGVRRHFHDDITVIVVFLDSNLVSKCSSIKSSNLSVKGGGVSLPPNSLAPCATPA
nr:probable protein phosphatase 2C 60 [Ipomoea batatas]